MSEPAPTPETDAMLAAATEPSSATGRETKYIEQI